jgi:small-conductance mechanosensitive channel
MKNWLDKELFTWGSYTLHVSEVLSFLLVITATIVISKLLQQAIKRFSNQQGGMRNNQAYIIGRITHYFVLFLGLFIALRTLGVQTTELALIASALGIGIGLGLQSIVNNFVSGIVILLEKSLKVGDFIELNNGLTGEVIEINMRVTIIRTNDNIDILIPNGELFNGTVTNWTFEEAVRRFRVPFSVAYGSDKNLVKQAALEAAANVSYTLTDKKRKTEVWMTGFGDSSLNFTLGVWVGQDHVKRPTGLMSDYLWALDDAMRKYNIEIPFPQRDIHIRSDDTKSELLSTQVQDIESNKVSN